MTSSIDAAECERAAIRAYLLGADDDCARHWEAAHRAALAAGSPAEAARYAFWLGLSLMFRGQTAQANGWFARAEALIAEAGIGVPGFGLRPDTAVSCRARCRRPTARACARRSHR